MSDYISIDEIPLHGNAAQRPYDEWLKIPAGMALEVTDQLNGQSVNNRRSTICDYFKRHNMPLVVMARGKRLFVARKAEAPA